jgi:hypothetical protein
VLAVVLIVELVALMFAISAHAAYRFLARQLAVPVVDQADVRRLCCVDAHRYTRCLRYGVVHHVGFDARVRRGDFEIVSRSRVWSNGVPGVNLAFPTDHGGFITYQPLRRL